MEDVNDRQDRTERAAGSRTPGTAGGGEKGERPIAVRTPRQGRKHQAVRCRQTEGEEGPMIDRQPSGKCDVLGCQKPLRYKTAKYCSMHYNRIWRGSKEPMLPERTNCVQCGIELRKRHQMKYCSHACCVRYLRGTPEKRSCVVCRSEFPTKEHGIFCSINCKREQAISWNHAKRIKIRNHPSTEKFTRLEIFERDRWRCQLCGKQTRRNAKPRTPLAPSLDHIVPISRGGTHTRANTQCAHFLCNLQKQSKILGQMRLFG